MSEHCAVDVPVGCRCAGVTCPIGRYSYNGSELCAPCPSGVVGAAPGASSPVQPMWCLPRTPQSSRLSHVSSPRFPTCCLDTACGILYIPLHRIVSHQRFCVVCGEPLIGLLRSLHRHRWLLLRQRHDDGGVPQWTVQHRGSDVVLTLSRGHVRQRPAADVQRVLRPVQHGTVLAGGR